MSSVPNVWCVGTAKLVREVSPLIDRYVRVRWIADQAALERNFNGRADCSTVIVEHTTDQAALGYLQFVKSKLPQSRRLVVVDACELKTLRIYLETALATEIVYRPLDVQGLIKSCGVTRPSIPPRAPSHA